MLRDALKDQRFKRATVITLTGSKRSYGDLLPRRYETASGKIVDGRFEADYASCHRLGIRTLIVALEPREVPA